MPTKGDVDVFDGATFLAGSPAVLESKPKRAFSDETISFLSDVSAKLMRDPHIRAFPDVASFAFWCRRANLEALAERYEDSNHRLGRGLVLHIAPSNVPVNFAFSWAFSHLAGNADVVRLPSKAFSQVDIICNALKEVMAKSEEVCSAFIRYSSSEQTTEKLSLLANARVIWGGDATVAKIRAMPCLPRCVDVPFPDRYSIALMDAGAFGELDEKSLSDLANQFFNDTYLMDQNACSSPRTVVWVGSDHKQQERFWAAVRKCALETYSLGDAVSTDKYVRLCTDAATGRIANRIEFDGYLTVVPLSEVPKDLSCLRGYGGYFYEVEVDSVDEVLDSLGNQCQTATCFGVDPEAVRSAVLKTGCSGIDRIVPVGKAMDIGIVWDGFDLARILSRVVERA